MINQSDGSLGCWCTFFGFRAAETQGTAPLLPQWSVVCVHRRRGNCLFETELDVFLCNYRIRTRRICSRSAASVVARCCCGFSAFLAIACIPYSMCTESMSTMPSEWITISPMKKDECREIPRVKSARTLNKRRIKPNDCIKIVVL